MNSLEVLNIDGEKSGSVDVPEAVFGGHINKAVIHQAIVMYQASLRQGNASTKERAYVSGGGKKPHKQKGGGRARAGSNRSPLWKGGGVTFGPHPRDFDYPLPKKIRTVALRESLNAKYQDGNLVCVDDIKVSMSKTKEFAEMLKKLDLTGKTLAIFDGCDSSVLRVSKNIPYFNLRRSQDVNTYDILRNKKVLITKTAFTNLLERVKK
ncbi:LSU ribosomal protein L4p (L1e) [hydrothermal vent metagenome]|uniref:LSU ribosomal protein L4p (L1e) n=1 Tax=hydrothermal vent metagenome TaxID=652676 RepID=A0A3B1DMC7_9ZZZZ